MINISLVILAKNEAHCICDAILNAKGLVNQILVVNDHSIDDTVSIATLSGAEVINLPFEIIDKGFGYTWNWMIKQARFDWVFILDADELIGEKERLHTLTRFPGKEVWALPRRKWLNYPIERTEFERYPDWQVRFLKRNDTDKFVGDIHLTYQCPNVSYAYRGPHIEHRQSELRTSLKNEDREKLYATLAARQGVTIHGGDIAI